MWISTRGVVLLSATALVAAAGLIACSSDPEAKPKPHAQVLVFSKTAGFGHDSIPAGIAATDSYSEPDFRRHLLGGILWAAGLAKGNCRA